MLTGSLVAIATPMREGGALDLPALRKLIDFHVANGTSGIVVVGTTGESPTVDFDEHCLLIKTAVEHAARRVKVVAGAGANSTRRGDRACDVCREGRRRRAPVRRAVLQQAHAGRAVPALPHDRRARRPADDPVQRAGPHGGRYGERDDAAPRGGAADRRHQGRDRRHGPRQRAPEGAEGARPRDFAVYSGDDLTGLPLHAARAATASSPSPRTLRRN